MLNDTSVARQLDRMSIDLVFVCGQPLVEDVNLILGEADRLFHVVRIQRFKVAQVNAHLGQLSVEALLLVGHLDDLVVVDLPKLLDLVDSISHIVTGGIQELVHVPDLLVGVSDDVAQANIEINDLVQAPDVLVGRHAPLVAVDHVRLELLLLFDDRSEDVLEALSDVALDLVSVDFRHVAELQLARRPVLLTQPD